MSHIAINRNGNTQITPPLCLHVSISALHVFTVFMEISSLPEEHQLQFSTSPVTLHISTFIKADRPGVIETIRGETRSLQCRTVPAIYFSSIPLRQHRWTTFVLKQHGYQNQANAGNISVLFTMRVCFFTFSYKTLLEALLFNFQTKPSQKTFFISFTKPCSLLTRGYTVLYMRVGSTVYIRASNEYKSALCDSHFPPNKEGNCYE